MKNRKKMLYIILAILAGSALLFSASELITRQDEDNENNTPPMEDIQRFSNAINQIKHYYIKHVEDEALFDNAIRGMLEGLDPHSDYLDEDDFTDLMISTDGKFGGLGLEVTLENGVIKVITPLDNSPAAKAGIQPGDYIIRLDQTPVDGLSLREAVTLMRGKKGTPIEVTILRQGVAEPIRLTIKRDIIQVQSVSHRLLEGKYGYIRLSYFQASTPKDVINAISDLKKGSKDSLLGLILDLRNNPGGLLDSAIEVSDLFIHNDQKGAEEIIVSTKGRVVGTNAVFIAQPGDILKNIPMVALINQGSASGAEIVAGALKDNKRAIIVGTKSFGKGSIQTVLPLDENHAIKLTTALYYTPQGQSIQAKGIMPDIVVENINVEEQEKSIPHLIEESDLTGSLQSPNKSNPNKPTSRAISDADKRLLYNDYQLYEALNVLKSLSFTHNLGNSRNN